MTATTEIVLNITTRDKYGSVHVVAYPMAKSEGQDYPHNIIDGDLEDLELDCYISKDYGPHACEISYNNVFNVTAGKAQKMAALLLKLEKAVAKAEAHEHGDVFAVFAKVIGAKQVCWTKDTNVTWNSESRWIYDSIARGRDIFRCQIREADKARDTAQQAA